MQAMYEHTGVVVLMTKWGARCCATCWSARWRSWRPSRRFARRAVMRCGLRRRRCGALRSDGSRSGRGAGDDPARGGAPSHARGRGERPRPHDRYAVSRETPAGSAGSAGSARARAARAARARERPHQQDGGVVTLDQARAQQGKWRSGLSRRLDPPISLCIGPGGRSTMIEPGGRETKI